MSATTTPPTPGPSGGGSRHHPADRRGAAGRGARAGRGRSPVPPPPLQPRSAPPKPPLFADSAGCRRCSPTACPPNWLADVRACHRGHAARPRPDHLPAGGRRGAARAWPPASRRCGRSAGIADPFAHPGRTAALPRDGGQSRSWQRALDYPVGEVDGLPPPRPAPVRGARLYRPARVSGSAGTGKTIVALHRAVFLARRDTAARVLLTTFSGALANALKLRRLAGDEPDIVARIGLAAHPLALRCTPSGVGSRTSRWWIWCGRCCGMPR